MGGSLTEARGWLKAVEPDPRLPEWIVVSDVARLPDPEVAISALPLNSAVIVRHPRAAERRDLALRIRPICRRKRIRLLIAADAALAHALGADGVHLPEVVARTAPRLMRHPTWIVTAAAHSPAALRRAAEAGADAALLSPVFATESHPEARPIGPLRFAAWVRDAPIPVYALGGVTRDKARRLSGSGATGIAGISGFLPHTS